MPFKIVRNDLTKMEVDAIVNTANEAPVFGDGIDAAVYKAAGRLRLLNARKKIGWLKEGEAAITPGFRLPAKYIIHAVSPRYAGGAEGEEERLRQCYRNSLALAVQNHCESIAFPLIATGNYGYPREEGMRIAVDEIHAFLLKQEMLVYLVVFDSSSVRLGRSIYPDLESYIDQQYVEEKQEEEYASGWQWRRNQQPDCSTALAKPQRTEKECIGVPPMQDSYEKKQEEISAGLRERMEHLEDSFQEYLFYLIQTKSLTNAQVYKRAIITKQTFSKIKNNPEYHPDKSTAMRLCVGLGLNLDETKDLLARAGYALSPCDKRDIIFSYFIEKRILDMIEIDIALEEHGLQCFIE